MSVPLRIVALVAATVALAIGLGVAWWNGPVQDRFWFWCFAVLASEMLWVRMPVGRATVSMASCFHFATVLVLPPGQAMVITAVSGLLAESLVMRKPAIRAMFNAGQASLAVAAAAGMLGALAHVPGSGGVYAPWALFAAGLTYFLVNTCAVSVAVALSERIDVTRAWWTNFGGRYELISNGALFSLGALLASHYESHGATGTLLVVFPVLVAFEGYRHAVRARVQQSAAAAGSADEKTMKRAA